VLPSILNVQIERATSRVVRPRRELGLLDLRATQKGKGALME
jgi:hypothetical protein